MGVDESFAFTPECLFSNVLDGHVLHGATFFNSLTDFLESFGSHHARLVDTGHDYIFAARRSHHDTIGFVVFFAHYSISIPSSALTVNLAIHQPKVSQPQSQLRRGFICQCSR
jgi:hypothetical protein